MKFKGIYTALTALSLVAAPTLASAAPVAAPVATPLTQPAPETVKGDNAFFGGAGLILLLLALAAIAAGIVAAAQAHDRPNSP